MKAPSKRTLEGKYVKKPVLLRTMCGKRGYTSRKIAAAKAKASFKMTGEEIVAYHCKRGCHLWHIGHQPRPQEETQ